MRCDQNRICWSVEGYSSFYINSDGDVRCNGSIKPSSIEPSGVVKIYISGLKSEAAILAVFREMLSEI